MSYHGNTSSGGSRRTRTSSSRGQQAARTTRSSRNNNQRATQRDASSRVSDGASRYEETTSAVRGISTRETNASRRSAARPTYEEARARRLAAAKQQTPQQDDQRTRSGARRSSRVRVEAGDELSGHSSLRRETVSPYGYEPGQGSRPFSYSDNNPIEEGFSLGIDRGARRERSWQSRSRGTLSNGRDWRPIALAAAGIVVAVIIVSLIFGR